MILFSYRNFITFNDCLTDPVKKNYYESNVQKMSDVTASIQGFKRRFGGKKLFLVIVVLPTALAGLYYGLIASDIYVSESHFILRSSQQQSTSGLSAALQGVGITQSGGGDSYTVKDFVLSRDALRELENRLHLSKLYGNGNVDFLNRFGGPVWWDHDFEALFRYYQQQIEVDIDSTSSIGTLTVEAFSAEDAYRINELLLERSEREVNWLNERLRKNMIQFAATEVTQAEAKARKAELDLSLFRNKKGVFDPERLSDLQTQEVLKLQDRLIAAKTQLAQVRAVTVDNPQIFTLTKEIESLQAEIDAGTTKVAGEKSSLSNKSAAYESLLLERDFAGKELTDSLSFLVQARNAAQQEQSYLERIVKPSEPDTPKPRRLRAVLATMTVSLIVWGILTILIAGVREHKD